MFESGGKWRDGSGACTQQMLARRWCVFANVSGWKWEHVPRWVMFTSRSSSVFYPWWEEPRSLGSFEAVGRNRVVSKVGQGHQMTNWFLSQGPPLGRPLYIVWYTQTAWSLLYLLRGENDIYASFPTLILVLSYSDFNFSPRKAIICLFFFFTLWKSYQSGL